MRQIIVISLTAILFSGCVMNESKNIDIQGNRGCRGIMPENTIEGFIAAVDMGVSSLELDVVLTADSKILVSHEPFMSGVIMVGPDGRLIDEEKALELNIYRMRLDEAQTYKAGMIAHPRFEKQKQIASFKPTLLEVINAVKEYCVLNEKTIPVFNIEVKSRQEWVGEFQVPQDAYAEIIVRTLQPLNFWEHITVQSFDFKLLRHIHGLNPNVKINMLVDNDKSPIQNLQELGFVPACYSPHYNLMNEETVLWAHQNEMKIVPWTVNNAAEMEQFVKMGVDGIITDYPNVAMVLADRMGYEVGL